MRSLALAPRSVKVGSAMKPGCQGRASFILSSTMKEEAPATGGNRGFRFHVGEPVMGRDYPSHGLFMSSNATGKPQRFAVSCSLAPLPPQSPILLARRDSHATVGEKRK